MLYEVITRREDGSIKGLIGYQLDFIKFGSLVMKVKLGKTGYAGIVDSNGLVIAHPNPDMVMKFNLLESDKEGWKGLSTLAKTMQTTGEGGGNYKKGDGTTIVAIYRSYNFV